MSRMDHRPAVFTLHSVDRLGGSKYCEQRIVARKARCQRKRGECRLMAHFDA